MKNTPKSAATAQDRSFADPIDDLPLPYIELDANGIVVRANRATLALHPVERGPLVGKLAWDFMAADEKDPSFASFCSALESDEEPPAVRRSLYDRSGHFRIYELHRSLVRDNNGKPVGMRMLCVDVTKTSKAYEETHRRLVQLREYPRGQFLLFRGMDVGIFPRHCHAQMDVTRGRRAVIQRATSPAS